MKRTLSLALGLALAAGWLPGAPPPKSPEIHPDLLVTFRLVAPGATAVGLELEGEPRTALQRDDHGIWTVTVGPLQPDLYGYTFLVDGARVIDPLNWRIIPNLLHSASMLEVKGAAAADWEVTNVPHGIIHRHEYHSSIVGDDRDFYVYTPPDYNPAGRQRYPVLYLLHGYTSDASAWTRIGRANIILDNLIAAGKTVPAIVVMPNGYGAPEIVFGPGAGTSDLRLKKRNYDKFREALFSEVIPQVERAYRVRANRESRAIAGVSMGGTEALYTGLNAPDRFAWIGAFGSSGAKEQFDEYYPTVDARSNQRLRLLLIACGTSDRLLVSNRQLKIWLKAKGVRFTDIETPGGHNWRVWRRNLSQFTPLLFRR